MSAGRVVTTVTLPEPGPQLLAEAADRVDAVAPDALAAALADAPDVLVCSLNDRIDAGLLEQAAPSLKAVCTFAVGVSHIDVAAASARGVLVTNTPGVLTESTADLTVALMLAVLRRVVEGDEEVRAGRFAGWRPDGLLGCDLSGATVGIVGLGRIGRAVARRLQGFDVRLLATERRAGTQRSANLNESTPIERQPLHAVLRRADVLTLHAPLTPGTHHLIDERALRAMKPTAVLVNTARGPLVDERALVRALVEGRIAGAGLDVYEDEPALAEGLLSAPNTVLLPHVGSATARTRSEMARLCAQNAAAVLAGRRPPSPVNADLVAAPRAV